MEVSHEEFVGSCNIDNNNNNNNHNHHHNHIQNQMMVAKGRRTKRPRLASPFALAGATSTSSSSANCGGGGGGVGGGGEDYGNSFSSPTTSGEVYESTEEEEDMANCLILLAQGDHPHRHEDDQVSKQIDGHVTKRSSNDTATVSSTTLPVVVAKAGFYIYECKTCNRTFQSFQALGGHRASHKRPKLDDKKPIVIVPTAAAEEFYEEEQEEMFVFNKTSTIATTNKATPLPSSFNKVNKVHECSICGSEFNSGQALGGHMRRHRASAAAAAAAPSNTTAVINNSSRFPKVEIVNNKQRNILPLDLNLPAPEDDHHRSGPETKFQFVPTQQALVFSAPALVDCHY